MARAKKVAGKKPRSVRATLEAAYNIIRDKRRWIANDFAQDKNGYTLERGSEPEAVRFWALGVLQHVDGPFENAAINRLSGCCRDLYDDSSIAGINDGPDGRKRILKAFRHAIKSSK